MDEGPSRSKLKRPFLEEDDDSSDKLPAQKRVRFPKGKKVKSGDYVVDGSENVPDGWKDPRLAAKERAKRRNQITAELLDEENRGMVSDITLAEVNYEDNDTFIDDGIQMEPFNLEKEREEGYFDAEGNYVEYINENEIKDAWLDSIDADKKFINRGPIPAKKEQEIHDLSSEELGKMKRRIANILEPGETVLQALRRLKGSSNNKKEKMSAETKMLFDQLTEDAMRLMENGDYNVYDERQEIFQREAEGYERLAKAREQVTSVKAVKENPEDKLDANTVTNGMDVSGAPPTHIDAGAGSFKLVSATLSNDDDSFDMFAEDDESAVASVRSADQHPSGSHLFSESGDLQSDYLYDESSGYYYSSSLGYYYDPSSQLYCCAATGQWYSYDEQAGTYNEVQQGESITS